MNGPSPEGKHPDAQSSIVDMFSQNAVAFGSCEPLEINSISDVLCESRRRIYHDFPLRINTTFTVCLMARQSPRSAEPT
jgi:hypothetical protein